MLQKALLVQAVLAAVAVLGALVFVGVDCAIGAAAGGLLSAFDFALVVLAARKLVAGPLRGKVFYTVALGAKLPILAGVVFLLVVVLTFNVPGVLIGFSTGVLAILYAGLAYQRTLVGES